MQKIKRINSFLDDFNAEMLTLASSFIDDYLGEGATSPVDYASQADFMGAAVKVTLYDFEDRKVASRTGKDIAAQYRVLSQQVAFMAEPLVCVPLRTMVQYKGRMMCVSAVADHPTPGRPLLRTHQCIEMRMVMDMLTETLNLSPYVASVDGKAAAERLTGPFNAVCFRGGDGRLYLEDICGLYPHFPPPRGEALNPAKHTVILRHELIDSTYVEQPLSPAAFCVFGTQDSTTHNINARETARIACQVAVAKLASRFSANCPLSPVDLVEQVHSYGVNLACLGLFLFYLERGSPAYRLVFTEMVARAMRVVLQRLMSEQIETEEIHSAIQAAVAQINNPASSKEFFSSEIVPILREKYMGFGSLTASAAPNTAPTVDYLDSKVLLARTAMLAGIRFGEGVDENGMSAFHYPIAGLLPTSKASLRLPVPFCSKVPFPSLDVACTPKGTAAADGLGTRHQLDQRPGASFAIERYLMTRERQLAGARAKDAVRATLAHAYTLYDLSSHLNRHHKLADRSHNFASAAIREFTSLLSGLPGSDTYVFAGLALFEQAKASILAGPGAQDRASCDQWTATVVSELRAAMHFFAPQLALLDGDDPVIAGGRSLSGTNPPTPSDSVYGLAVGRELVAVLATRSLAEAVPIYEWMAKTAASVFGEGDSTTLALRSQLGVALLRTGVLDVAEAHLRGVLASNDVTKRPEDAFTVSSALNSLASLLSQTGRFDESIEYFTRDVQLCMGTNGPAHPSVSQARSSLGAALLRCNNIQRAEEEMLAALEGLRNTYGQTPNPDVADALINVGALRAHQSDYTSAEAHFMEAVAAIEATEGDRSARLLVPYEHLERLAQKARDGPKESLFYKKAHVVRDAGRPILPVQNDKIIQVVSPL